MRRAHDIPQLVKVASLARWFTPWTVTREQWSSITRSAVSMIAVDTLLFSRIRMPLCHQYRVFDRPGTHVAFRGTYMQRMHTFLEESGVVSVRTRHRRCAREIAARLARTTLLAGSEVYPANCCGLLIGGHGGCSTSSLRGDNCPSSDGLGSSEV